MLIMTKCWRKRLIWFCPLPCCSPQWELCVSRLPYTLDFDTKGVWTHRVLQVLTDLRIARTLSYFYKNRLELRSTVVLLLLLTLASRFLLYIVISCGYASSTLIPKTGAGVVSASFSIWVPLLATTLPAQIPWLILHIFYSIPNEKKHISFYFTEGLHYPYDVLHSF